MKINLIIGAGQLGSRHLQGLLKYNGKQKVFVLDPTEASLEVSRQRAGEIEHTNEIVYTSEWSGIPEQLDLVIVATNASVRESVVSTLLNGHEVKYLVLEKILFQTLEAYSKIGNLIRQKDVPTWVNHPRRMATYYQAIREKILHSDAPITLHTYGSNFGLACNAVHWIDLISFLANSAVADINTEWLQNEILESKRPGNIEFLGSVKGSLKNGSLFLITCTHGEPNVITNYISAGPDRWVVTEGTGYQVVHIAKDNNYKAVIIDYLPDFQSSLTTRLANELFENETCELTPYEAACGTHIPFIKALLDNYNSLSGLGTDICPIT